MSQPDPQLFPPANQRDRPLPGTIGKYRVLRLLGEGATSEVFLARDEFMQRDVAVKRLRLADLPGEAARFHERFYDAEAALVGRLQHPNVVQILDAVADPVAPYVVMEYVAGDTLKRHCLPDALLPLERIVELGFKCSMALGYVARQGLIHRDVKPANLLAVRHGGEIVDVKVSDFGSALHLDAQATQVHRVGSLAYMSPEQLDGAAALDARADLYSLAAVLYHLVTGRAPFEGPTQAALMSQIFQRVPAPAHELREGVPASLSELLARGLAKSPDERPADWEAFAQGLAGVIARRELPLAGARGHVTDTERFGLLRSLEFFREFGDVELWEVVHRARWQRLSVGHALYRKGEQGRDFHILAEGEVQVHRDGRQVAALGRGTSVGEMAYLAPSEELRVYRTDVLVSQACTTISFTPQSLERLTPATRHRFDQAFIQVLVRRLHTAHEALHHPRRIL